MRPQPQPKKSILLPLHRKFDLIPQTNNLQINDRLRMLGQRFWDRVSPELHRFLCTSQKKPKKWGNECVSGKIRIFCTVLILKMAAKYELGVELAIPLCALVLKYGLNKFCRVMKRNDQADGLEISILS